MVPWEEINPDEIYLRFYTLGYRERLSYFEKYVRSNPYIGDKEKNEMAIDHLLALFELGKYEKFLYEVDPMIEYVVDQNIYRHNGEDAFYLLLFKKAASHYNLEEWDSAKFILLQLKRIRPEDKISQMLLSRIERKKGLGHSPFWQSMVVLGFLFSFFTYILDIFIIEPFAYKWHEVAVLVTELSFVLATVLLCFLCYTLIRLKR